MPFGYHPLWYPSRAEDCYFMPLETLQQCEREITWFKTTFRTIESSWETRVPAGVVWHGAIRRESCAQSCRPYRAVGWQVVTFFSHCFVLAFGSRWSSYSPFWKRLNCNKTSIISNVFSPLKCRPTFSKDLFSCWVWVVLELDTCLPLRAWQLFYGPITLCPAGGTEASEKSNAEVCAGNPFIFLQQWLAAKSWFDSWWRV